MPKVSQYQLEERRRQILEAAMTCFARKGFHETTMAEIASEAGVSDTLAYRYFAGKEQIIAEAMSAMRQTPLVATDDVASLASLLEMLIAYDRRRFRDREAMTGVMGAHLRSWAEALHDADIRRDVLDRWRHHLDSIEGLIGRAMEGGEISAALDRQALARLMLATHYGMNLQAVLDPELDLEKCGKTMVALLFGQAPRDGRVDGASEE